VRIHHSRPSVAFTIVPNATLQDERLSFAARGMLAYLLSLPDGWNTNADKLAGRAALMRPEKARGEGRRAMRAIFGELKEHGYIRHRPVPLPGGRWGTEVEVSDIPLTEVPVTGTSVPPAETADAVDNSPELFSEVAPRYRSPGVGSPARRLTGTSVSGTPSQSTDLKGLGDQSRVGSGACVASDKEHPIANSHRPRVPDGPEDVADDAHLLRDDHSGSATTDRNARASEPGETAVDNSPDSSGEENSSGGAAAPLSEPAKPAASDASPIPGGNGAEDHKRRELDRLAEWIRQHPESVTQ
jgi:hypothetical protein